MDMWISLADKNLKVNYLIGQMKNNNKNHTFTLNPISSPTHR